MSIKFDNNVPTKFQHLCNLPPAYVPESKVFSTSENIIQLASNENPRGCSPEAGLAFIKATENLHRYPDNSSFQLRTAIANRFNLDPERIICGNGSGSLITLIANVYGEAGCEVMYSEFGFIMYKMVASAIRATPKAAPEIDMVTSIENLLSCVTEKTRILFLANPNNPTGSYLSRSELINLRSALPSNILLVLDEAYIEFLMGNDYSSGMELVDSTNNTIMLRTFSKIFGLAALRLGWAYCPSVEFVNTLNRFSVPFSISYAAQVTAIAALEDWEFVEKSREHNLIWLPWFSQKLTKLGLKVYPSAGNFLCVEFPVDPRFNALAASEHLDQHGVLVRTLENYGLNNHIRITIGLEEEMLSTVDLLSNFFKNYKPKSADSHPSP